MKPILSMLPRAATADRKLLIGASEAAAVLGLSPYQTPMGVWLSKQDDAEPLADNDAMRAGRHMEAGTIAWAAEQLGAVEVEPGIRLDEPGIQGPAEWLAVRPDGALHFADGHAELVEAKTSRLAHQWADGDAPEWYVVQVQVQLACVPCDAAQLAAYLPMVGKLETRRIVRDDELILMMLDKLADWHARHLDPHGPRLAPAIDGSDAALEFIKRKFRTGSGKMRVATEHEAKLIIDLSVAKAAAKSAKAAEDLAANRLREAIGDDDGLSLPNGKVTWKSQAGAERLDQKLLRAKYPEAAAACTVQGEPMRVLRLSLKGDTE